MRGTYGLGMTVLHYKLQMQAMVISASLFLQMEHISGAGFGILLEA